MKCSYPLIITVIVILGACRGSTGPSEAMDITGTWKLISGLTIQSGDTVVTDYTRGQETIKLRNPSHFAFLTHDLDHGQDSAALFVAGGGRYSFSDNRYTEHLEYCNYREWEGHSFDFDISVHGDTLVQTGIEKVESLNIDRVIIETYHRIR